MPIPIGTCRASRAVAVAALLIAASAAVAAHPPEAADPAAASGPASADAGVWRELAAGLEFGRLFAAGAGAGSDTITVLRVDPARWRLDLHCLSETGSARGLSARQWCEEAGLVAAVNAGMFEADRRRHVGYLRHGGHVNNGGSNTYRSAAAFGPRRDGLPPFRIFDLDERSLADIDRDYDCVVQNLRLIKRPGQNRWSPQGRRWSEVALAEDREGRMLLIASPAPRSMHEFNELLLSLPLGIVCAQHLEGGPEAQLYVRHGGVVFEMLGGRERVREGDDAGGIAWPLPNVIGIRAR